MEDIKLVQAAAAGDRNAFEQLVKAHMPALASLTYRMVGNREDSEDLQQESILRAFTKLAGFRGNASFRTWLFAIATRACIDHLRKKQRWRWNAQVETEQICAGNASLREEVLATLRDPGFAFDVHEHIAFCFSCVARTLPPDQEAAVILREIFAFSNSEAAQILELTESVFRHRLSAGRKKMQEHFENLCALINKNGACYQCHRLREATPAERRGTEIPAIGHSDTSAGEWYRTRVLLAKEADLEGGKSRSLHDLMFGRITRLHERGSI